MCVQLDADVRVINGNRCECVFVNSAWKGIAEVEHPLVALEGNPADHRHNYLVKQDKLLVHPKMNCYNLLTLMLFQTCLSFVFLLNQIVDGTCLLVEVYKNKY